MNIKLQPCPNCMSKRIKLTSEGMVDFVVCKNCGYEGAPFFDGKEWAIKDWNKKSQKLKSSHKVFIVERFSKQDYSKCIIKAFLNEDSAKSFIKKAYKELCPDLKASDDGVEYSYYSVELKQ